MNKYFKSIFLASCRLGYSIKPTSQSGFTLLELMISMALGLLLLTGIGTIFIGSNQTYRVQEQNARIQESGRYALEIIGRSVRQAGYWNMQVDPMATATGFGGTPVDGTDTSVTVQYDGTGGSDCTGAVIASGAIVEEAFDLDSLDLRCNASPLISNVEEVQFLYGVDTSGDQSANLYTATPTDWTRVVSVRACVLIRSEEQGITTSAQSFLDCENALAGTGTLKPADDSRLRRTFVATFNLRNRISVLP